MFPPERPPPYRRELEQIGEVIQQAHQMVRDDPEAAMWYCDEAQRMTAAWSRKWTPIFGRDAATDPAARLFSEDAAVAEAETLRGLAEAERSLGKPQPAM